MGRCGTLVSVRRCGLVVLVALVGTSIWIASPAQAAGGGTKLWRAFYDGGGTTPPQSLNDGTTLPARDGDDTPHATVASPDGTKVFVTGSSVGPAGEGKNYTTIAYNTSTGARLWVATYTSTVSGAPVQYDDVAYAIAVSPDGTKVYVTGKSRGAFATIAYNTSTGAVEWTRFYSANGAATAITVSPDGSTLFVTGDGTQSAPGGVYDYATVAYNAVTGALLWFSTFNGTANGNEWARAITVTPDGARVIMTGYSRVATPQFGFRDDEYVTIAYAATTGAQLWVRHFNPGPRSDEAFSMAMSPDGSFVAVTGGAIPTGAIEVQFATIAYDPVTGAQRWVAFQPGAPGIECSTVFGSIGCEDKPVRIAVSPDATKLYVTGTGNEFSPYQTIAYAAATGATLWVSTGPNFGEAVALAVSGDGAKVVVTGWTIVNPSWAHFSDYTTVAYDTTTGAQLWVTRHNFRQFGSQDNATAIAIVPGDHTVIVTGGNEIPPTTQFPVVNDFATAAIAL